MCAEDDLPPADAARPRAVDALDADAARDAWAAEDRLVARRVQPGRAGRAARHRADEAERDRPAVDADDEPVEARARSLQRRDLGHVDRVPDVERVAGDLDPCERVDREVPE